MPNNNKNLKARNPSRVGANASGDRQIAVTRDMTPDYEREARRDRKRLSKGESAHTPGPWTLIGEDGDGDYAILGNERPSKSGKVTSAGPITVSDEVAFIQTENFANAKLIAAAPETAEECDNLREQRDELLNFVLASVNFYEMCAEDVKGTGGLGTDETNFLIVGRELIKKAEAQ